MAKMGKNDRIRVSVSMGRNSNLIHRYKAVIEIQNRELGKVSRTIAWYATLQQAVDHTASQLTSLNLYYATGIIPTIPERP
jgi:hypothetical protein